jgi:hypothetical protein
MHPKRYCPAAAAAAATGLTIELRAGLVDNAKSPPQMLFFKHFSSACCNAAAATAGFTIELCAGLVDKAKSLPQIVVEEIHEEVRAVQPQAVQIGSTYGQRI